MADYRVIRLSAPEQVSQATRLFELMAALFEESHQRLSREYVTRLLAREDLWVLAAITGDGTVVGGLTAHVLPMTRSETRELFIYDLAVEPAHRRRGVGRLLMKSLTEQGAQAGIQDAFVPADNEDTFALEFYKAAGGIPAPVTFFTFSRE